MKLKAIIVDDEEIYAVLLQRKLAKVAPDIKVEGAAKTVAEAEELIRTYHPDILFLDINLNGGELSFDLLAKIPYEDYEIIFVSGYDQFAVEAFDFEATGFLVKPVVDSQLVKFVEKATRNIERKRSMNHHYPAAGEAADEEDDESAVEESDVIPYTAATKAVPVNQKIGIPTQTEIEMLLIADIARLEAAQAVTNIFLKDGRKVVSSYYMGKFARLLEPFGFMTVHKSHMVNLNYIKKYQKQGIIILHDGTEVPVAKRKRIEFLAGIQTVR